MAYDEALADRIVAELAELDEITTRKMFGGLCVMWHGHMLAGVLRSDMMARVGADAYERLSEQPGAGPMTFTGRPMKGILLVEGSSLDDTRLRQWVSWSRDFVSTLPPKSRPAKQRRRVTGRSGGT